MPSVGAGARGSQGTEPRSSPIPLQTAVIDRLRIDCSRKRHDPMARSTPVDRPLEMAYGLPSSPRLSSSARDPGRGREGRRPISRRMAFVRDTPSRGTWKARPSPRTSGKGHLRDANNAHKGYRPPERLPGMGGSLLQAGVNSFSQHCHRLDLDRS